MFHLVSNSSHHIDLKYINTFADHVDVSDSIRH